MSAAFCSSTGRSVCEAACTAGSGIILRAGCIWRQCSRAGLRRCRSISRARCGSTPAMSTRPCRAAGARHAYATRRGCRAFARGRAGSWEAAVEIHADRGSRVGPVRADRHARSGAQYHREKLQRMDDFGLIGCRKAVPHPERIAAKMQAAHRDLLWLAKRDAIAADAAEDAPKATAPRAPRAKTGASRPSRSKKPA